MERAIKEIVETIINPTVTFRCRCKNLNTGLYKLIMNNEQLIMLLVNIYN